MVTPSGRLRLESSAEAPTAKGSNRAADPTMIVAKNSRIYLPGAYKYF